MSNKKTVIGLVMDAAELRAVEVVQGASSQAVACGCVPLPAGLVEEGIITDLPTAARLLNEMFREHGFSNAPIVIGAKNDNMLLRNASFPDVPEEKLRGAVLLQAQQFIPVPTRELVLDFAVCGRTEQDGRQMVDVLLVGAKKTYIQNLIALVKQAGRTLEDIDSALLAAVRVCTTLQTEKDKVHLVADIDHETVNIGFVRNETVLLTRSVNLPRKLLELQDDAGRMENEEAEQLAAAIADDLRTSMLYFANMVPEAPVTDILLTGTLNCLPQLMELLGGKLSLPITRPKTYPHVEGISPDNLYKYAVSISLALRHQEG